MGSCYIFSKRVFTEILAVADQLLMYDSAVLSWIGTNFDGLVSGKTLYKLVGPPDRAFAEYVTPTGTDPDGRMPLPRAALTVDGDFELDLKRYNHGDIRLLGYADATKLLIRKASYPTPVRFPYTLNFWTEYKREMNLLVQKLAVLFRSGRATISVNVDSIDSNNLYGTKTLHLVQEGQIVNAGNVPDPGRDERELRRTLNFYLEGWLWDIDPTTAYAVKQVELEARDYDLQTLFEIKRTPEQRALWSGDGSTVSFGPTAVPFLPVVERTLILDATVGGENVRNHDNSGSIIGSGVESGSVNYVTGEVSVEYSDPPDDDTDITVAYFTTSPE